MGKRPNWESLIEPSTPRTPTVSACGSKLQGCAESDAQVKNICAAIFHGMV
jgi:hypothetical protein